MLVYEKQAHHNGYQLIIGVDEAGRGPLAGPVVASAVALKQHRFTNLIKDSKKITEHQRVNAFYEIHEKAYVGVGIISESVIDEVNILQATFLAMATAVRHLVLQYEKEQQISPLIDHHVMLLIDGPHFKSDLPYSFKTIVKGDDLSMSIACASIIAKVTRDRILKIYDQVFPQYGFKDHKGYATTRHRQAIRDFGLSMIHRRSFCL
ncbi:MAG: ribonuclease HII [Candidatus Omnitrophota bacterium]|jgi:ribonuclease HII|nr:ribonuclease HII [Candidatus Omnitrophota bacterium]